MADINQILKEKLSQAEVPYNPEHWAEMDQKLNAQSLGMSNKVKGFIGAAAVVAGVTLAGLFMDSEPVATDKNVVVEIAQQVSEAAETVNEAVVEEIGNINNAEITEEVIPAGNVESTDSKTNEKAVLSEVVKDEVVDNNNKPMLKSGSAASAWGKFSVTATEVCEGKGISFSIEGIVNPVSFLWSFGDGKSSNIPNPTHVYKNSGVYDVSLTLTDIATGVDSSQTKENLITVLSTADVTLDWELSDVLDVDAQVNFDAVGLEENETVVWNLGDGNTTTEGSFTHKYTEVGNKKVSLTATNNVTGCVTELAENVKVINDYNLLAPTGFNPGSLIEKNKLFIPVGLKNLKEGYTFDFEIFNPRKGMERVYNTNTYAGWNGKFENVGNTLPAGIYSWQAIVKRPDGSEIKYMGSVTLLQ